MIRIEKTPREAVRIFGALTGPILTRLFEKMSDSEVVLDLSEVSEVDAASVHTLACLPDSRCRLVSCPR